MKSTAALFLLASVAMAEQPPTITSVRNAASLDNRLSPGVPAVLHYASSAPFDPRTDSVEVSGQPVAVFDQETGADLTIRIPVDLPVGPATVVLATAGGRSGPFPITVDAYAPGIFGATRSQSFTPGVPEFGCTNAANPGETLNLFAAGLGSATPTVSVGLSPAQVLDMTPVSLTGVGAGAYRVRFVVPPGDGLRLVTLTVAGRRSNAVQLPVGKAMLALSTADFTAGPAAPESIETAYVCNRGTFVQQPNLFLGTPPGLPDSLGGISIRVKDSAGVERTAPLYGVAPEQVNYVIPADTAPGIGQVSAYSGAEFIAASDLEIQPVAPKLFYQYQVVRLRDGVQTVEQTLRIDMGPATDIVYLVLYGTGIRRRSSLAAVSATIDGADARVEYAGPQGAPGLDQVNVRLPRVLANRGSVQLELNVEGRSAFAWLLFKSSPTMLPDAAPRP